MPSIPEFQMLTQEDHKFRIGLVYIVRPCLSKQAQVQITQLSFRPGLGSAPTHGGHAYPQVASESRTFMVDLNK